MIALQPLLTKDGATDRFQAAGIKASATPTYVRHKPGETTIVAYRFDLPDGTTTYGYARWCHHPARAAKIFAKSSALSPRPSLISSAGLNRIDEHTVLYSFPNDARLPQLHTYVTPAELRRSLTDLATGDICGDKTVVEVLRYKPQRRVVHRVELYTEGGHREEFLVRYTTKPHADELHGIARHLRGTGINTPKPVAQFEQGRVSVDEFIDGRELLGQVIAGSAAPEAVAAAVAEFHSVTQPVEAAPRTRVDELARSTTGLEGLGQWRESMAEIAGHTARVLAATRPPEPDHPRLLHGDLHTKNLLETDHGISFVDLERVCVGDPAIDLGYFLAHCMARPVRYPNEPAAMHDFGHDIVENYRNRHSEPTDEALRWHTAIGLVDQALLVARHLETGWLQTSQQLLETAIDMISPNRTLTRNQTCRP